ncbi:uncharacterized protein LOC109837811 [Asparagus officinalis]|uniref:uncharacterized protein LOC109837811 n=1 Tax=Asparagus officinalis TaxID=4686 RepID=UPI00098E0CBE|nr:uncharacterized protein LOC109837811 [Asparagus officinalis]
MPVRMNPNQSILIAMMRALRLLFITPNICFMTHDDEGTSRTRRKELWYLDSGYSNHMTGNKKLFATLSRIEGGNVSFDGGEKGKIIEAHQGDLEAIRQALEASSLCSIRGSCTRPLGDNPSEANNMLEDG